LAETTHFREILITRLSDVVWLCIAGCAEVLLALSTSDAVLCHMLSCFLGEWLTLIIFQAFLDFTWQKLHDVAALTANEILVQLHDLHSLCLFNSLMFFISQILFELICLKWLLASRT
jgi:hypothetical protein